MELNHDIRIYFYSFFAEALDYPNSEFINKLFSKQVNEEMNFFKDNLDDISSGIIQIKINIDEFISHVVIIGQKSTLESYLLDLQKEYTRLCHTSRPRMVPLFESVYKEGKLLQESTIEVARLYHRSGLQVVDNFSLPPDHIALELEFMSYLCFQEAQAHSNNDIVVLEKAKGLQLQMLKDHLYSFAIAFAQRLQRYTVIEFYRLIGKLLENFITLEAQKIS